MTQEELEERVAILETAMRTLAQRQELVAAGLADLQSVVAALAQRVMGVRKAGAN